MEKKNLFLSLCHTHTHKQPDPGKWAGRQTDNQSGRLFYFSKEMGKEMLVSLLLSLK